MTRPLYAQLKSLNAEIVRHKKNLDCVEKELQTLRKQEQAPPVLESCRQQMELLRDTLAQDVTEKTRLHREALASIAAIPDCLTRLIFELRYLDGYSWTRVALSLPVRSTPDSVRVRHNRYLYRKKEQQMF